MLTRRIRVLISYPLILATGARGGNRHLWDIGDYRARPTAAFFFGGFLGAGRLGLRAPRGPWPEFPPTASPAPAMRLLGFSGRCRRRVAQRQAGKMAPGCQLPLPPNPRRRTQALGLLDQPKHTTTWPKFSRRSAAAWPLATATGRQKPSAKQNARRTPGQNARQRPGNPQARAFCAGRSAKRQEAGRSGCWAFHFGAGSAATERDDGTTRRRDDGTTGRRGTCCCS